MQYLLMIYSDESMWAKMGQAEAAPIMEAYRTFTQDIVKSGHFRAGSQLQPSPTAKVVTKSGNTDGPFAETKEQLGGYYLVECKDIEEAMSIAKKIPSVKLGDSIEVRPLTPM